MLRKTLVSGGLFALALLPACSSGPQTSVEAPEPAPPAPAEAPAQEPEETTASAYGDDATTLDGIYTLAQAQRGEEVYQALCKECHETEDWTESAFLGRWQDQSTFQLWYYINDRMPYENPWSLTRQQVTDVMTYILHLNGLPEGQEELGVTDDDIDKYWIVWDQR